MAMASKRAFYYGAGGIALAVQGDDEEDAVGEEEEEEGCGRRVFGSPAAVRPVVTQQFFPTTTVAAAPPATQQQQQQAMVTADKWARPPPSRKSRRGPRSRSSQYRGVTYYRRTGRWESHIWDCGKQVYLGGFDTAQAAARAYDQAAIKFRGVEADINFSLDDYKEDIKKMSSFSKEEYIQVLRRLGAGSVRAGSRFRGVTLHKCGKWEAKIGQLMGKKFVYLGLYDTEMDAAKAYDEAAMKCRGEEAVTSFEPKVFNGELNLQSWGCSEPDLELSLGCSGGGGDPTTFTGGGDDTLHAAAPGNRRTSLTFKMPKEEETCYLNRSSIWIRPSSTPIRPSNGGSGASRCRPDGDLRHPNCSRNILQMSHHLTDEQDQIGSREKGTSAAELLHVRRPSGGGAANHWPPYAAAWPWLPPTAADAAEAASSGFPLSHGTLGLCKKQ